MLSWLIPSSSRGAGLVEHLRQLLALLLGGALTGDAVLVCPLIRICVPRREHLVVVACDLGDRNRRRPAHAPATLADLIWSFQLITRLPAFVGQRSMCRYPCHAQPEGKTPAWSDFASIDLGPHRVPPVSGCQWRLWQAQDIALAGA
jgi:hypothetical protein